MTTNETEIIVAKLEERDAFVRAELRELKQLVTNGFEKADEERGEMKERLTALETEVKFAKRIGAPILGIIITAVNTYLNSLLRGGN